MRKLAPSILVVVALGFLAPLSARADLYAGNIPFVNSSVDVLFTGDLIGSDTVTVDQGEVDLELLGSGGVYSSLTLSSGTFDLVDTTMMLDQSGIPRTLQITGFGFDVLNSVLSLTPTGVTDEYTISGTINVDANRGMLTEPTTGVTFDFDTDPELVEVALLGTSTINIIDTDPNDDFLDVTADLRFDSQQLVAYDIGGIITGTMDISSINTLSLEGGLSSIPEPGTAALLLLGLLALRRRSRY